MWKSVVRYGILFTKSQIAKTKERITDMESNVVKTLCGMEVRVMPKQEETPAFDTKAIQIKHIDFYDSPEPSYGEEEITEELIARILQEIPQGIDLYLSLDSNGEDDWLEVNCDGQWLALGLSVCQGTKNEKNYYSWNPQYAGVEEYAPIESGGQSPIEKYLALTDMEAGVKAVEYFIRTGKRYPGVDWAEQL